MLVAVPRSRTGAPSRLAAAIALACVFATGGVHAAPAASPFDGYADAVGAGSAPQIQLAALILNGEERDDSLAVVQRAGATLVALDYFAQALGLVAETRDDAIVFATPL